MSLLELADAPNEYRYKNKLLYIYCEFKELHIKMLAGNLSVEDSKTSFLNLYREFREILIEGNYCQPVTTTDNKIQLHKAMRPSQILRSNINLSLLMMQQVTPNWFLSGLRDVRPEIHYHGERHFPSKGWECKVQHIKGGRMQTVTAYVPAHAVLMATILAMITDINSVE